MQTRSPSDATLCLSKTCNLLLLHDSLHCFHHIPCTGRFHGTLLLGGIKSLAFSCACLCKKRYNQNQGIFQKSQETYSINYMLLSTQKPFRKKRNFEVNGRNYYPLLNPSKVVFRKCAVRLLAAFLPWLFRLFYSFVLITGLWIQPFQWLFRPFFLMPLVFLFVSRCHVVDEFLGGFVN